MTKFNIGNRISWPYLDEQGIIRGSPCREIKNINIDTFQYEFIDNTSIDINWADANSILCSISYKIGDHLSWVYKDIQNIIRNSPCREIKNVDIIINKYEFTDGTDIDKNWADANGVLCTFTTRFKKNDQLSWKYQDAQGIVHDSPCRIITNINTIKYKYEFTDGTDIDIDWADDNASICITKYKIEDKLSWKYTDQQNIIHDSPCRRIISVNLATQKYGFSDGTDIDIYWADENAKICVVIPKYKIEDKLSWKYTDLQGIIHDSPCRQINNINMDKLQYQFTDNTDISITWADDNAKICNKFEVTIVSIVGIIAFGYFILRK